MGNYTPKSKIEEELFSIYEDITSLNAMKYIYTEIIKIINNNPQINKPNSFYTFLNIGYQTALIMGIRRHVKLNKDSVSLIGTLTALKEKLKEEPSGKESDIVQIDSDIAKIKKETRNIEYIADKFIAHIDKQSIEETKNIDQGKLGEILFLLDDRVRYYLNKYFGFDCFIGPEIKDLQEWKEIFKVPWIDN